MYNICIDVHLHLYIYIYIYTYTCIIPSIFPARFPRHHRFQGVQGSPGFMTRYALPTWTIHNESITTGRNVPGR